MKRYDDLKPEHRTSLFNRIFGRKRFVETSINVDEQVPIENICYIENTGEEIVFDGIDERGFPKFYAPATPSSGQAQEPRER